VQANNIEYTIEDAPTRVELIAKIRGKHVWVARCNDTGSWVICQLTDCHENQSVHLIKSQWPVVDVTYVSGSVIHLSGPIHNINADAIALIQIFIEAVLARTHADTSLRDGKVTKNEDGTVTISFTHDKPIDSFEAQYLNICLRAWRMNDERRAAANRRDQQTDDSGPKTPV
jgi:hypothetical protein